MSNNGTITHIACDTGFRKVDGNAEAFESLSTILERYLVIMPAEQGSLINESSVRYWIKSHSLCGHGRRGGLIRSRQRSVLVICRRDFQC